MIDINEATQIVLSHKRDFGTEVLPIEECTGRVLRQEIKADRDFPPFTRVTMDGIAFQWAAYEKGQRNFPVQEVQAAGSPQLTLSDPAGCLEVMTGAILPQNTDTVVRYEDVSVKDGVAHISQDAVVRAYQNAHKQGLDRESGDLIVSPGAVISPAEVGVAATVGLSHLEVARLPKAVIVSTGDELVPIKAQPAPHQIRTSNSYTIQMALSNWCIQADRLHIDDKLEEIQSKLADCVQKYDIILLSGGVSKGKFDYVPEALEAIGVQKYFHRVKQRPGKPFWFGELPGQCTVFALPGNPVSSFMCTLRYVGSWLRASLGLQPLNNAFAALSTTFDFKPDLTYFLQVKTQFDPETGRLMAHPVAGKGSGDLANLVDADAFLELPQGKSHFEQGEVFPILFYRSQF